MNIDELTSGSDGELTPATLASYLDTLSKNSEFSPYDITLKVNSVEEFPTIRKALNGASDKYFNLDLTGSTITSIEIAAFARCKNLASVTIPDSITTIERSAFYMCKNLTSISIGSGVKSIEIYAFFNCTGLTSITIPDSVTNIEQMAFLGCTSLASVIFQVPIPASEFRDGAFPDKLRDKFYEKDKDNGTPGTYTRANGSST
jgi:hypothetical protein